MQSVLKKTIKVAGVGYIDHYHTKMYSIEEIDQ
jgi:hypothetical protein